MRLRDYCRFNHCMQPTKHTDVYVEFECFSCHRRIRIPLRQLEGELLARYKDKLIRIAVAEGQNPDTGRSSMKSWTG